MKPYDLIKTALRALRANITRTALTMLGIIIGIASVISLLSLGAGAKKSIQSSIESLGTNMITISAGSQTTGVVRGGMGSVTSLTVKDAEAIQTEVSNIAAVSPELTRNAQVIANGNNTNTQITGVVSDYATVHNYQIESGSFITQEHYNSNAKVAVLGPDTATTLFGDTTSAIGQTIKINKVIFKVIGVTVSKGSSGFTNSDDIIFIPLSTAQKIIFGQDYVRQIVVQAKDTKVMTQVQTDITSLLLTRHNISDSSSADFTVRNSADMLSTISTVTTTLSTLLAGIASISLLVGGIGIMNIMIVTVTERTREIGLRKAIGAKNSTIQTQFLVESLTLTLLGGFIGIALGFGLSLLAGRILNMTTSVTLFSVLLATFVSAFVGIIFGFYPAYKASKLNPIDALRFE